MVSSGTKRFKARRVLRDMTPTEFDEARKNLDEFMNEVMTPHLDALVESLPADMALTSPVFAALALPPDMQRAIMKIVRDGTFIYRYYVISPEVRKTYETTDDEELPTKASSRVARVIRLRSFCLIIHEILPNYDIDSVPPMSITELHKRFIM
jgi:hypothetical protein